MAKPDRGALQAQFLAEHAKTGISPKDWCKARGLNYSSSRRYIMKPSAQKNAQGGVRKIKPAQVVQSEIAQNIAHEFDLRSYGLNDMQIRLVEEYLVDQNRTAAYKRAGYKGEGIQPTSTPSAC